MVANTDVSPEDGPAPNRSAEGLLAAVQRVTGVVVPGDMSRTVPLVVAIVVTTAGDADLPRTLRGVAGQTRPVDLTVVVDADAHNEAAARQDVANAVAPLDPDRLVVTHADGARTFARGARAGIAAGNDTLASVPGSGVREVWWWFLHADSAPAPGALESLLAAAENAPSVAVVGPKVVEWGQPDTLVALGLTVTANGRCIGNVRGGELDQQQHDDESDVLAVGLAGALVRAEAWERVGGSWEPLSPWREGVDLCLRLRAHGWRVVVAPTAVVEHARRTATSQARTYGPRLRAWQLLRLRIAPRWAVALVMLWAIVVSPVRAVVQIALKDGWAALDEVVVPWAVAGRVLRSGPRWRTAGGGRGASWRALMISPWARARLAHERRRLRAEEAQREEMQWLAPYRQAAQRARRMRAWALAGLTAATTLISLVALPAARNVLTGGGQVVGGAQLPASGGWAQWWQAVSSGWNMADMGLSAPADAFVAALAPAMALTGGSVPRAVALMYLAALPLAALGAWFAAGTVTRSTPIRVCAAVGWAVAPPMVTALAGGVLSAAVAHATLGWLVFAVASAFGLRRVDPWTRPRRKNVGAFGGAGLLLALLVAAAPSLLVLCVVVVMVAGVTSRRRSLRSALWAALMVPLPALALLGPTLWRALVTWQSGGWRVFAATPGALAGAGPHDGPLDAIWSALGWSALQQVVAADSRWRIVLIACGLLIAFGVAVAAVGSVTRVGPMGRAARIAILVVPAAVATAAAVAATTVASSAQGAVAGWPHPALSVAWASLGVVVVIGADTLAGARPARPRVRVARALGVVGASVSAAAGLGVIVTVGVVGVHSSTLAAVDQAVVPAVVEQMQTSARQVRAVVLEASADEVTFDVMRSDGPQITDSSAVATIAVLREGEEVLTPVVSSLLAGETQAAEDLADRGVGAVVLRDASGVGGQMAARFDATPGLERVTEGDRDVVWRVVSGPDARAASWARLIHSDGSVTSVSAEPMRVSTELSPGDAGTLVVAEAQAPGWHASLNGESLAAVPSPTAGTVAFEVPAGGGHLEVAYQRGSQPLWIGFAGVLLAIFALVALPVSRWQEER